MQVRRSAASMEARQQVAEGNALALVAVAAAPTAGGTGGGGGTPKEPAGLPCPRCESTDTKFCYYNNYNLGQPRHFCKGCRRYWTRGGALRNVPVGGGTRKPSPSTARRKQRAASSTSTSPAALLPSSPAPLSVSAPAYATARPYDLPLPPFMPAALAAAGDHDRRMLLDPNRRMLLDPDRRMLGHDRRMLVDPDRRLLDLGGSFTSLLEPAPAPDVGRFSSAGFLVAGGLPSPTMPSAPALPPPASQALPEGMIWGMGWPDLSI